MELVAGSGEGGINYIENSSFDINIDGAVAYKDSASELPDDGTGGSPTLSVAQNTVSPLRGDGSLQISKPASNVQGEGVGILSTVVADADKGKILIGSFDYDFSDSNYSDGDFRVYAYDVTNSNLIRVNGEDIKAGKGTHWFRFQAPINSSGFRFIIHCATTDSTAMTLQVDRVRIGPQEIAYGAVVGPRESYSPSNTQGFGTLSNESIFYQRIGAYLFLEFNAQAGSNAAVEAQIELPAGLVIKSGVSNLKVGTLFRGNTSSNDVGTVLATGGDTYLNFGSVSATANRLSPLDGNDVVSNNDFFSFTAKVPIGGVAISNSNLSRFWWECS